MAALELSSGLGQAVMGKPSRDTPPPLAEDLGRAVEGLRALLEPTPEQLAASYQRVRQALAAAPPVAPPALTGSTSSERAVPRHGAARSAGPPGLVSLLRRRAPWVTSGPVALVASLAGFELGRNSVPAVPDLAAPVGGAMVAPAQATVSAPPLLPGSPRWPVEQAQQVGEPSAREREGPTEYTAPPLPGTAARDPAARDPRPAPAPARARPSKRRGRRPAAENCSSPHALQRAECLLRRNQPQQALHALGHVAPEEDPEHLSALTLLANCQLGRDVRAMARRFFEQWSAPHLGQRIQSECPSAARVREGKRRVARAGSGEAS